MKAGPAIRFLPREFYMRDARVVARALVGTYLVHGDRVGRIVETEAYCGRADLACHAKVGLTKRTRTLYGPPGHAYVFLVYGMHECFNVVCFGEGRGHAALVRAVEPVRGVAGVYDSDGRAVATADLVAGGALGIGPRTQRPRIAVSARVGVAYAGEIAEAPWRFFDASSKHVSRPPARMVGLGPAGRTS